MRRHPAVILCGSALDFTSRGVEHVGVTVSGRRGGSDALRCGRPARYVPCNARTRITLLSKRSVCYDYKSRGEVSERLKELASKASVGGTLPWVQIPPSPPSSFSLTKQGYFAYATSCYVVWRI